MIVDTSALLAIAWHERGHERLLDALGAGGFHVPAPVLIEIDRVAMRRGITNRSAINDFIERLREDGRVGEPFTDEDARIAVAANERFGTGNGRGGTLNLLDLMVYAVAKRMGLPILCTGKDFAATDAAIHPASRID